MKSIVVLVLLGLLFNVTNARRCYDCAGSCSNPQIVQCRNGQNYCYIGYGPNMQVGCADKCTSGSQVKCCTSDLCNSQLQCWNSDGRSGREVLLKCAYSQRYCYKDTSGIYAKKGCAETCTPGRFVKCCSNNYCNGSSSLKSSAFVYIMVFAIFKSIF